MSEGATAYPLAWPAHRPRTPWSQRKEPRFRSGGGPNRTSASTTVKLTDARERLADELERLGARYIVVSTNMELRADGQVRASAAAPTDPGVAIYFRLRDRPIVLACDRWNTVAGTMAAIAAHIDALRGQERWGIGTLEEAFAGFVALPSPGKQHWRAVLGFALGQIVTREMVQSKRREMAKLHHTDAGGAGSRMAEINAAADEALVEIGS